MKRSGVFLAMLLALALAFAGAAASSPPPPAADQATAYLTDPAHDGYMADANLGAPLTQAWSVTLPAASSYPLIVNGTVFVITGDDTLWALNQATGSTIWSRSLGGSVCCSGLTYDRGNVFVLSGSGALTAFTAASGSIDWSEQLPGDSFGAPPTATNGIVYAGSDGAGVGGVRAVQEHDGYPLWSAQPFGTPGSSSPAVTAEGVYVSLACQQAYAFDPVTGSQLWHHDTGCEGGGGATPVVADGIVFARDSDLGNVMLSASDGSELGPFNAGAQFPPAPAVANDVAYIVDGESPNRVLDAVAGAGLGTTSWTFSDDGELATAPLVAGGLVFIGSHTDNLYALDAASGATTWSTDLGVAPTALAAANGTLIVAAGSHLMAYETAGQNTGAPSNKSLPSISGSGVLEETEAADVGVWWSVPSSYTYQWELCDAAGANCVDIVGATASSYAPPAADNGKTLRVRVVATNAFGTSSVHPESAPSATLVFPAAPPSLSTSPVVSGTAIFGKKLTTTKGSWAGSPTSYRYRWQRCDNTGANCVNISNATSPQYTLVLADVGHEIRSEVLASNAAGPAASGYAPSAPTSVVLHKPVVVTLPKLSGTTTVGNSLSVTTGTWKYSPTSFTYHWFRCSSTGMSCTRISGATSSSYLLTSADVGHKLEAKVTASNGAGSATATSNMSAKITS